MKAQKILFWNAIVDQTGNILKSKLPVVCRMACKTTTFGIEIIQP
ncbi:MAG: hypothetical protein WA151_10760 [Desulfatirhabdiaceae bacterium]